VHHGIAYIGYFLETGVTPTSKVSHTNSFRGMSTQLDAVIVKL